MRGAKWLRFNLTSEPHQRNPGAPGLDQVSWFVASSANYYLPFVELRRPVVTGRSVFLHHGVDVYRSRSSQDITRSSARLRLTRWELTLFYLFGSFDVEVPIPIDAFEYPPWSHANSFHLRIRLPPGLRVRGSPKGKPEAFIERTKMLEFSGYDEGNAYLYARQEDLQSLISSREKFDRVYEAETKKVKEYLTDVRGRIGSESRFSRALLAVLRLVIVHALGVLEEAYRATRIPRIVVRVRVGRGIGILLLLLWVVVILSSIMIPLGVLSFESFVGFLSVHVVIVLAMVVFSIDKEFLRELIPAHVLVASIVIVLVPLIARYRPVFPF